MQKGLYALGLPSLASTEEQGRSLHTDTGVPKSEGPVLTAAVPMVEKEKDLYGLGLPRLQTAKRQGGSSRSLSEPSITLSFHYLISSRSNSYRRMGKLTAP